MRQLSAAWIAYANDNKGHFCTGLSSYTRELELDAWRTNHFADGISGWLTRHSMTDSLIDYPNSRIWPYVQNYDVFRCPDDFRLDTAYIGAPLLPTNGPMHTLGSYWINGYLGAIGYDPRSFPLGCSGAPDIFKMKNLSQIKHPASTFLFSEGISCDNATGVTTIPVYPRSVQLFANGYHTLNRYCDGASLSFVDGHAIFWSFADDTRLGGGIGVLLTQPDCIELQGWSGAPFLPPGYPQ
jgi:hypothetical protein